MLRFLTAGESHGKGLVSILEGIPANLEISAKDINDELARRQVGYGRGGRMKIERDEVNILSGVRLGKTMGSPIAMMIANRDHENWKDIMSEVLGPRFKVDKITKLRPGHADFAGTAKYDQSDIRNILERASARETAARVAVGAVCKKFLKEFGIEVFSHVIQIGDITVSNQINSSNIAGWHQIWKRAETSDLRCADADARARMKNLIDKMQKDGDSLGGIFEVVVLGVPVGLGSHIQWDKRLSTKLSAAVMSIPAIKGVEIGIGFAGAKLAGSKVHDAMFIKGSKIYRKTNNAGGLEGGMTNGEPIVIKGAMKPIATIKKPLMTVDLKTQKAVEAYVERADTCAVPAAGVVAEAMVSYEIASSFLEKHGGDSISEIKERV
ncbi:MAG: chorismate synthase [bacterium]